MPVKLIALFFLSASIANAGPIHWVKTHPTVTSFIAGGIGASVHAIGLRHCRQGNVENCQAKYGAAWGGFAAATVLNFSMITAGNSCYKQDGGKFCNVLKYGGSLTQLGFGIEQWKKKGGINESLARNSRSFTFRNSGIRTDNRTGSDYSELDRIYQCRCLR